MTTQNEPSQTSKTFSFTPKIEIKALEVLQKYPEDWQASAVMPLLDLAQRQNGGWLSQAAIEYVANRLSMPLIRVYEVASFYTMYNLKPIGEHHIEVCTNLPCWLRGSDQLVQACEDFLGIKSGQTTDDGKFTMSEVECLGACVNAPMMQINDDYYEDLNVDATIKILSKLKAGSKPKTGSQSGRRSCEPATGLTSLLHQKKLLDKQHNKGKG
ncbi:MAG: NADH-quinone oxidoreductase subunit NuoE [Magnetovibrio sp.]|nr:NADH-quinone oxidoreductase subunit NuoE [Magnetovibrio sp.]|tara:strand:+ start:987 stop:1625 length:639 start_codon:yes stop_codon:yes gene_type:complete